jgi:hypothetical protein
MLPSWVSSCEIDGYTIFLDIKQNRYTALKSDFGRALLTGDYARLPQRVLDQIASLGWQREDKHNFARVQIEMPTIELSSTAPNPTTVNVLVASAFICQIMTRCRLGTRRFEHVLRSVSGANDRASMRHKRASIEEVVHATDVMERLTLGPNACLIKSLTLHRLLSRHGHASTLVFAVRLNPFGAHCWLQRDNVVLNDTIERVGMFTPLLAVG